MKYIFIIVVMIIASSCEHATPPVKKIPYCPPPVEIYPGEWKMPYPYHKNQRASYDGKNLIFRCDGKAYLLNLKTGVVSYLDLQSKLPDNVRLSVASEFFWCPYDNNQVLVYAITGTDLPDDSIVRYYYGQNIYIVTLNGSDVKDLKRVTPSILGPAGAPANLNIYSWLPESSSYRDLILLSYVINDVGYAKKYLIQEDKMIDDDYGNFRAISHNGKILFSEFGRNSNSKTVWVLNGNEFVFNEEFHFLDYCSFSPSGKYLALSVSLYSGTSEEDRRFNEIWIINVEKFLSKKPDIVTPDRIINLRFDFCMYAFFTSPCAEFISETDLAVAMYKDGDDKAYLWKVGIDGKLLGQLTFEP